MRCQIEEREARQQFHSFSTDCGVTGLAGDYLLRGSDGRTWPCAHEKFEQEYRLLPIQPAASHPTNNTTTASALRPAQPRR
jgi:hypothetical protein